MTPKQHVERLIEDLRLLRDQARQKAHDAQLEGDTYQTAMSKAENQLFQMEREAAKPSP